MYFLCTTDLLLLSKTRQRQKARQHHMKDTNTGERSYSAVPAASAATAAAVLVLWCVL